MKQDEAKIKLINEFDEWKRNEGFEEKPTVRDALDFFADIESNKSHLLNFRCTEDKWQKLKSWLYQSSRIRDN